MVFEKRQKRKLWHWTSREIAVVMRGGKFERMDYQANPVLKNRTKDAITSKRWELNHLDDEG